MMPGKLLRALRTCDAMGRSQQVSRVCFPLCHTPAMHIHALNPSQCGVQDSSSSGKVQGRGKESFALNTPGTRQESFALKQAIQAQVQSDMHVAVSQHHLYSCRCNVEGQNFELGQNLFVNKTGRKGGAFVWYIASASSKLVVVKPSGPLVMNCVKTMEYAKPEVVRAATACFTFILHFQQLFICVK